MFQRSSEELVLELLLSPLCSYLGKVSPLSLTCLLSRFQVFPFGVLLRRKSSTLGIAPTSFDAAKLNETDADAGMSGSGSTWSTF